MNKDVAIGRITECVESISGALNEESLDGETLRPVLDSLASALRSVAVHLTELDDRQQVLESSIEDLEFE